MSRIVRIRHKRVVSRVVGVVRVFVFVGFFLGVVTIPLFFVPRGGVLRRFSLLVLPLCPLRRLRRGVLFETCERERGARQSSGFGFSNHGGAVGTPEKNVNRASCRTFQ